MRRARSSVTGRRFVTLAFALAQPAITVVEVIRRKARKR